MRDRVRTRAELDEITSGTLANVDEIALTSSHPRAPTSSCTRTHERSLDSALAGSRPMLALASALLRSTAENANGRDREGHTRLLWAWVQWLERITSDERDC
jgi:hypothetical protein